MKSNFWKMVQPVIICAIILIAYFPALRNGFTDWDDPAYLTENEIITSASTHEAISYYFTEPAVSNYHPFTMITYKMLFNEWGMNPKPYHVFSLLFHLINTLLVFYFIKLLTKGKMWASVLTAILFGLHPMHVESVAWISEIKDVLYSLFFLIGLICYINYVRKKLISFYIIAFLMLCFSLLSKPAAVIFPLLLFLIDYFEQRKFNFRLVAEKIPFLIIAFIFGVITFLVQKDLAVADINTFTFFQRIMFGTYGFCMYIYKALIPFRLSAFYPYPRLSDAGNLPMIFYIVPFIFLLFVGICIRTYKKLPVVFFGILFYFISIILVLQFMSVGTVIMAERYSYIPYIGLFFIMGAGLQYTVEQRKGFLTNIKWLFVLIAVVYTGAMCYITNIRISVWKNPETLWTDVMKKFPPDDKNFAVPEVAYKNRGNYYGKRNETDKALKDFEVLVAINSKDDAVYSNLGNIYALQQKIELSLQSYSKSIELNPNNFDAYFNRAITYSLMKFFDNAIKDYNKALEIQPDNEKAFASRAYCYYEAGKYDIALKDFNILINRKPETAAYYFNRGLSKFVLSDYKGAIEDFIKDIELDPANANALYNISVSYSRLGKLKEALEYAKKARVAGYIIEETYIKQITK